MAIRLIKQKSRLTKQCGRRAQDATSCLQCNQVQKVNILNTHNNNKKADILYTIFLRGPESIVNQSELLGQFRLIGDRASDVSGGRICLTQNAYAKI